MRCCTRQQRHSIQIQITHTQSLSIFRFFSFFLSNDFCRLHLFNFALHVFCFCVRCVACIRAVRDDVCIVQAFASRLTNFSIFPRMEKSTTGKKRKSGRKQNNNKKCSQRKGAFSIFGVEWVARRYLFIFLYLQTSHYCKATYQIYRPAAQLPA